MKETRVEDEVVKCARARGGLAWKWISSRRGVPDRIVLLPVPEEHQAIVARYVKFLETKAPAKGPTPQQAHVHRLLREIGFFVEAPSAPSAVQRAINGGTGVIK